MKADAVADCPVCTRPVPAGARVPFHYDRGSGNDLRICVAVDVRRDDFAAVAQLQNARALAVGLDRITVMLAAATSALERVAAGIEARTEVAKAAEARAAKSADEYLRELVRVTDGDDSGPVPLRVVDDDSADDGSH